MATSNLRFRIIGDDDASPAFLRVAAAARLTKTTFDDMGQSALSLTKLVGGAGLIPVAAAASAALIELSVSAAAGAGALGIFGLSVAGIGKDMIDSQTKITAAQTKLDGLTKGTADYKTALMDLHQQQQVFNKEFGPAAKGLADLKTGFSAFKEATRGVTTNVMGKAFELLASVLPKLAPVANAAGRAVGGLIDDLTKWTKGPAFKGLLKWFETSGPKAITHFGHSVGNILKGLGGILKNFVGPGDHAAKSLQQLTKRFADWGNSKGVSDSVNKFLRYVSDNGPTVSSVFKSLADVLPKLAVALGGLGSLNLTAISLFLNLIAGMSQGTFDVLVKGLFAIYAGVKLLSIIQGAIALIKGIAAVTKVWAEMQVLLDAALDANPIGLIVLALVALVAGLVIAYKKSETFRNIVNGAFNGVKKVAKAVFDWLKGAVSAVIGFVKGHWQLLVGILGGPIGLAVAFIVRHWGQIKAVTSAAINAVVGFVKGGMSRFVNAVSSGISNVLGFYRGLGGRIIGALGNLGALLYQVGKDIINGLWNGIKAQVGGLLSYVGSVASKIKGVFAGALKIGSPSKVFRGYGQNIMEGLLLGIADKEVSLQFAMARIAAAVQKAGDLISHQMDRISNLQGVRSGFLGTFTGNSVFGTDLSTTTTNAAGEDVTHKATIADAIAFQKKQAEQARRLAHDVRKVTKEGLSKSLVRQLRSQGTAGAATLHALAQGSRADIRQLNRLNNQTVDSLRHAGMTAGNFVRGGSINADIKHAVKQEHILERQENTLQRLEHHLKDIAHSQKKDQTIVVEIDGEAVIKAIHRRNKRKGVKSAGV